MELPREIAQSIPTGMAEELDRFMRFSAAPAATPVEAERRLLETLSISVSLRGRAN